MSRPKKSLGQNFLYDHSILESIISVSGVGPDDTVVEIGPGHGTLTRLLAGAAKKVIAIELDEDLYNELGESLSFYSNVELVSADVLEYKFKELGPFKVVSNIPYYITTPIIFRLLDARKNLRSMTLTIQKEVAERIAASPGKKDFGVLSIGVQFYGEPKIKFIIPKEAFRPVPKVDSAVIQIDILDGPRVKVVDEKFFFRVVKTAFAQRRKTLSNALKSLDTGKDIRGSLMLAGIDPVRRAETLCIEEFARLSDILR